MEEFKNLKEIIELCSEELIFKDENVNATLDGEDLRELRNLINKCKEQETINNTLNGVIKSLTKLGEEHMEMINLMAMQLSKNKSLVEKVCKECPYAECIESKSKNCVIDYFRKKAKGE